MPVITHFFSLNDASANGHFPGNPIIPGAVLLADVLEAIVKAANVDLSLSRVKMAKFFHPVRPGDNVQIDFTLLDNNAVKFSCKVGTQAVLAGHAEFHS